MSARARWLRLGVPLALCLLTAVAYHELRHNEFVSFDDPTYTTGNPDLRAGLSAEGVRWAFTTWQDANWFPLTWLSLLLDYELWGLDPFGYHLTNLLLHLASTWLLFAAFHRMTGALWRSAFVTAVFALHPLHVESVAWAAERKDVLSGAFWMLTLLAYARFAERPSAGRYAAVFASLALGLMAKATAVTLPFVLLLLDAWPLGRLWRPAPAAAAPAPAPAGWLRRAAAALARVRRDVLLEKLPLLALVAASSAVTLAAQRAGGAMQAHARLSVRLGNAAVSYAAYLGNTVWPADLAFFYPHRGPWLTAGVVAGALLLLVVLSALAVLAARRVPAIAVGWLWYLGTLVPMLGIVQVGYQAMADRYTYVPLVGVAVALAWGGGWLAERAPRLRAPLAALAAACVVGMAFATAAQVRVWRDNESLFTHAIAATDGNYMAHYSLGYELLQQERYDEAVEHLREASRLQPLWGEPRANLGVALLGAGRAEEAAEQLSAAVRTQPSELRLRLYLARAQQELGDLDAAWRTLEATVRLEPRLAAARLALAEVQLERGRLRSALRAFGALDRLTAEWPAQPDAAALAARLVAAAEGTPSLDPRSAATAARLAERLERAQPAR